MELKDVILSTLAEIEEMAVAPEPSKVLQIEKEEIAVSEEKIELAVASLSVENVFSVRNDEVRMLEGIRERLLVLFEGFQSPNNAQIEAKVDLTLNFFEYLLGTIDNRLENIKKP
jgi:hypothetical protein